MHRFPIKFSQRRVTYIACRLPVHWATCNCLVLRYWQTRLFQLLLFDKLFLIACCYLTVWATRTFLVCGLPRQIKLDDILMILGSVFYEPHSYIFGSRNILSTLSVFRGRLSSRCYPDQELQCNAEQTARHC